MEGRPSSKKRQTFKLASLLVEEGRTPQRQIGSCSEDTKLNEDQKQKLLFSTLPPERRETEAVAKWKEGSPEKSAANHSEKEP